MGQNKKIPGKTVAKAVAGKVAGAKREANKVMASKPAMKTPATAKTAVKPVKIMPKTQSAKPAPIKAAAAKGPIGKSTIAPAVKPAAKIAVKIEAKAPVKPAGVTKVAAGVKPGVTVAAKAAKPVAAQQPAKAGAGQVARPAVTAAAIVAARAAQAATAPPAVQRTMPAAVAKLAGSKISAPATPKDLAQKAADAHQAISAAAAKKPVSQRHGFKTNEWIVYPAHGVGRIVAIEEQEIAGMALELFVIQFEKDKMTLRVPTGKSTSVGMRKLADEGIVRRAMETLKGRARIKRTMWSRRAQEFETKINSGDLVSIAEVVRDLFRAENQPEQSYSERQLYEAALDRMAREIAAVDKLDDRGAVQRITEILSKSAKGRRAAAEEAADGEIKAA